VTAVTTATFLGIGLKNNHHFLSVSVIQNFFTLGSHVRRVKQLK